MTMGARSGTHDGLRFAAALASAIALVGCGGGGSGGGAAVDSTDVPPATVRDATAYSSSAAASLIAPAEIASVTTHTLAVGATTIAYTATAGHLNAREPRTGADEASMFYIAYTVPAKAAPDRPLVFFYNGGPGSATVWLHLGSFAPRRIVTHAPSLAVPLPYALVDNAESLIDVADLVFVDAVGTGYSEAIAPATNRSFWGTDSDAALMRDFIARYAAVNQRAASPTFLFGESYGTTRSAVLADLMLAASMRLDGVALQSSILDYNANCDVFALAEVSCEGNLPSYGMVGAFWGLTRPVPSDLGAWADGLRAFAATRYAPAARAYVLARTPAPAGLVDQLVDRTGAPATLWTDNLDLDATSYRSRTLPGQLMGRYDARIAAVNSSALAAGGDPSSTLITAPFAAAANDLLKAELLYDASAAYTLLSNAITTWTFSHDGRALPDTVPDLAAALTRKPSLRVFSIAGYHDLATPFRQTELDLARLGTQPGLASRVYAGGHMTYLDDDSRARLRRDIAAFIAGGPIAASVAPSQVAGKPMLPSMHMVEASTSIAVEIDPTKLAQGGDPYLPAALRALKPTASPAGVALSALVRSKIAERDRDVYR